MGLKRVASAVKTLSLQSKDLSPDLLTHITSYRCSIPLYPSSEEYGGRIARADDFQPRRHKTRLRERPCTDAECVKWGKASQTIPR